MAFGLNLRAINGVCSAQSHRQGIKHAKNTQSVKLTQSLIFWATSIKHAKNTQSVKHTQSEQR